MLTLVAAGLSLILVDPLVKVFPGTVPVGSSQISEVARGEVASWQVVVQTERPLADVVIDVGAMGVLGRPRVRAIGLVPVDRALPAPPKDKVGTVPGLYPDPLLTDLPTGMAPGMQAYWVDVEIPKNAKAGEYTSTFHFKATDAGQPVDATVALRAKVYRVTVGKSRLWVTNWYSPPPGDPRSGDPGFWRLLEIYGRNMASHRQNMAVVSPISYTDVRPDGGFDFTVFNRWVETMRKVGVIGRIEGGHLGGRIGGVWTNQFEMTILELKDGKTTSRNVDPSSPDAEAFYSRFLPALVKNLRSRRWLDIYRQHLADEPTDTNAKSYVAMRNLVRRYAPEIKVMEANHSAQLAGSMDLWVPELNFFADSYPFYQDRRAKGEEVWFYTCVYPQGEYANRFIELPLLKTRLLHWMNFKYGATGYLHWGWNHWSMMGKKTPFEKVVYGDPGGEYLPAGDCFIVYPAKDGGILDSIRWESMRDGIADYELLSMLAKKDEVRAQALANRLILGFTSYVVDPQAFRAVRHDLLEALAGK